jgi:hypothetical protein
MIRIAPALIGFAAAILSCTCAGAAPAIGIVQDVAGSGSAVRLGFIKVGNDWQPACAYSANGAWTCRSDIPAQWLVRFRGKQIGTVIAKGWLDAQSDSTIGLMKIVSGAVPHIGARNHTFGGWLDKPAYRPLVATSAVVADSASAWTQDKPDAADAAAALAPLRKLVATVPDCGKDGEPIGTGRAIAARDIRIAKLWRSNSGARLYGASVAPSLVAKCNFTADALADVWLVADGAPARALPALAEDEATHALVDIGDFAGDGSEDALFFLSGYDEDGFILYYDRFTKSARISWHYH